MDCDFEELIRKIELILIMEGQHDKRFKLGETIRYAPYEVKEILRNHKDEVLSVIKVEEE